MCCNRNNNNVAGVSGGRCNQNNVAGTSGCRCNQNNVGGTGGGCNQNNVGGTGGRCGWCRCECRCEPREPQVIAVRGPGCIDGTGRCNRFANGSVQSDRGFDSFCGQVSPSGNTQRNPEIRRCNCFNRYFNNLLDELSENSNGCNR